MRRYGGRLACLLSGLWLIGNVLLPPWQGRSYVPDSAAAMRMQQSGGFGLADPVPGVWRTIWNPPPAFSSDIAASRRWPWQPVVRGAAAYHVEIDVQTLLLHISMGLALIGCTVRLIVPQSATVFDQRLIHLAWCWGWAALLACLLYLATWAISCQWGETPPETATLIGYASLLLVASAYSLRSSRALQAGPISKSTPEALDPVSNSREKAIALVVGLVTGGGAGWGLAMLSLTLFPAPRGPEYPGVGAAIGPLVVGLTGLVFGGLVGVLFALVRINISLRVTTVTHAGK